MYVCNRDISALVDCTWYADVKYNACTLSHQTSHSRV